MDTGAIVIRIKTPSGDMDSSVDCPSLLNFNDLLVSVRSAREASRAKPVPTVGPVGFHCCALEPHRLEVRVQASEGLQPHDPTVPVNVSESARWTRRHSRAVKVCQLLFLL